MKLTFLGATKEVGRSCVSVESDDLHLFMDCGVAASSEPPSPPVQNVKMPQAIALTHGHLDHSGFIPAIYKHANPPVLCTFPTIPLVNMLVEDMAKLLDEKGLPQLYNAQDLKRMNRSFLGLPYDTDYQFFNGDTLKLHDAGHIIGSAMALLKTKSGNLLYTGDMNSVKTEMHSPARVPREKIDYLIMESTYGNREHPNRRNLTKEFIRKIKEAVQSKQTVVVPSFAVGRTQEILQMLYDHDLIDRVVLDGMGLRATETYLEYPSYLKSPDKLKEAFEEVDKAHDSIDRKKHIKPGKILLCTAGMMEGGPVLSYIQRLKAANIPTRIFLTGFQAIGTNGKLLLEKRLLRINGKTIKFEGDVQKFDFSAHSGRDELIDFAKKANAEKTFLVHGDMEDMTTLFYALMDEGLDTHMPELGEKVQVGKS